MIDVDKEKLKEKMRKLYSKRPYVPGVLCQKNPVIERIKDYIWNRNCRLNGPRFTEEWIDKKADEFIENTIKILEPNIIEFLNDEELSEIKIRNDSLKMLVDWRKSYDQAEIFEIFLLFSDYYYDEYDKWEINIWYFGYSQFAKPCVSTTQVRKERRLAKLYDTVYWVCLFFNESSDYPDPRPYNYYVPSGSVVKNIREIYNRFHWNKEK